MDNPTDSPDVDPVKARKVVAYVLVFIVCAFAGIILLAVGLLQTISFLLGLGTYELASRIRKEMKS